MSYRLMAAPLFTSHMVLQRDVTLYVWGQGESRTNVSVQLSGYSSSTRVLNGVWKVELPSMEAGGPYRMEIGTKDETIILEDVWVGEVWLLGGQSNVEQPLFFAEGGIEESRSAYQPGIRLFTTSRRPYPEAKIPGWHFEPTFSNDSEWLLCTPEHARHFSAIGYHYAKKLHRELNVAIGIISCNWGGTGAEAWLSREFIESTDELKEIWNLYERSLELFSPQEYEQRFSEYLVQLQQYINLGNVEERLRLYGLHGYHRKHGVSLPIPVAPIGPKSNARPGGLYETMLLTMAPFGIRGVIWYQGESNAKPNSLDSYPILLTKLIGNWRKIWGNPQLPFLIVQLPKFVAEDGPDGTLWALMREAQEKTARHSENVWLVPTIDLGEADNIHPVQKEPVADRLANAALSNVYGLSRSYMGPVYRFVESRGNVLVVHFEESSELHSRDVEVKGFAICGSDLQFIKADQAKIVGNSVEVSHPLIENPLAVRYAWSNMPDSNLINQFDLPAPPFRMNPI
jgi:sialate O-acetylesterase